MIPNEEQKACIAAHEGVYAVAAGPGSGKTETLIQRYLSMLMSGISPKEILNLTFTNSAAKEMAERAGILKAESVFRTFHAFAMDLLKQERANLPFALCDTVIPVEMQDYQLLFDLVKTFPAIKNWRELQERISNWKKKNIQPVQAIAEAVGIEYFYARAYEEYELTCRQDGWLDFDSLMYETVALLETNEEVRARHKRRYISVDEFQDTDAVQIKLLQLLFDGNIFCVGDLNQGIFEWRGAAAQTLANFSTLFPDPTTLYLGRNYRSTKKLVSFFKDILPVDNGIASHLFTENEDGRDPTFIRYANADVEAEQVLASITDPENTAILARTNRQLFIYQRLCTMRKIKYKILGKRDFWEQPEIKKLLALAKESDDTQPANVVLSDLIQQHGLLRVYQNSGRPLESNPIENINSVVKMAAHKGSIQEFLNYLRRLTRARKSSKGLTLSTVHQAKGLEWKNVFVVGVNQGMMPHRDGEINEERRIFYVGATRAAEFLQISFFENPSEFITEFRDQFQIHTGGENGE